DLDREPARQLGNPDRAPGAQAPLVTPELRDRAREAVRDERLLAEAGRRADEDEHLQPALDAVERAELVPQAPAHQVRGRPRGERRALDVDVAAHAAAAREIAVAGEVGEP